MTRRALTLAALALAMCGPVLAQRPGGPGGRPGGPFGRPGGPGGPGGAAFLLMMPEVQQELKLSQEQVAKLREIMPAPGGPGGRPGGPGARPGAPGQPGGSPEDRRRFQAEREQMEKKLAEVLNQKQLGRLRQLELQQAGMRALERREVAEALKLNDGQRQQVQTAVQAERETMRAEFEKAQAGGDFRAVRDKMQEVRKGTDAKIAAILTEDQKKQLQELQGDPFRFPEGRFGRPGGPGGPGRPGGAPRRPGGQNGG